MFESRYLETSWQPSNRRRLPSALPLPGGFLITRAERGQFARPTCRGRFRVLSNHTHHRVCAVCTCVCVFAREREHVHTYARLCLDAKVCKHVLLDVYSIIGCVCMAVSISFVFFSQNQTKSLPVITTTQAHAPYVKEFKNQSQSHPYPFHHNPSVTFMIFVRQQTPNQAETFNFFTVIQY